MSTGQASLPRPPGPPCPAPSGASSVWNKLDRGLTTIYAAYREVRAQPDGGEAWAQQLVAREQRCGTEAEPCPAAEQSRLAHWVLEGSQLGISLEFCGDLGPIVGLGAHPVSPVRDGVVTVGMALEDLERVAAHPHVLQLRYGEEPQLDAP